MQKKPVCLVFTAFFCLLLAAAPAVAGEVLASIRPVHSLLAGVMQGTGEPGLLLSGQESPHHYLLKPSTARALSQADLVVWIGPEMESFLTRPLEGLAESAQQLTLSKIPGLRLLPVRRGELWMLEDDSAHDDHLHEHDHAPGTRDMHLWLDPLNAVVMVKAMAEALQIRNPTHAERYRENAKTMIARLHALDEELQQILSPVRDQGFLVVHDFLQYFDTRYKLRAHGAILSGAGHAPGAARLTRVREALAQREAVCVFAEPQYNPRMVDAIVEDAGGAGSALDPVGSDLPADADQYFSLMRNLAAGLRDCLSRARD